MAELGRAVLELTTDSASFNKGLTDAEKKVKGLGSAFGSAEGVAKGFGSSMLASAAGVAAGMATFATAQRVLSGALDFIGSSIEEAAKAESVAKSLETAMRTAGVATEGNRQAFADLAAEMQRATVYEDDQIVALEAMGLQLGVLPSHMDGAIHAAANLASGLGIDLEKAMTLMVKANNESFTAFGKLGISIDETRAKAEGLPYVIEQINKHMGGQAAAEVETYAGQMKQLGNEWGNLKEAFGGLVVSGGYAREMLRFITTELRGVQAAASQAASNYDLFAATIKGNWGEVGAILAGKAVAVPKVDPKAVDDGMMALNQQIAEGEKIRAEMAKKRIAREAADQKKADDAALAAQQRFMDAMAEMSGKKTIADADAGIKVYLALANQGIRPTVDAQEALNKKVTEAIKVYEDLGREAPKNLTGIQTATAGLLKSTTLGISQLTQAPWGLISDLGVEAFSGPLMAYDALMAKFMDGLPALEQTRDAMGVLVPVTNAVRDEFGNVIGTLDQVGRGFARLGADAKTSGQMIGAGLLGVLEGLPATIARTMENGAKLADAFKSLASQAAGVFTDTLSAQIKKQIEAKDWSGVFSSLAQGGIVTAAFSIAANAITLFGKEAEAVHGEVADLIVSTDAAASSMDRLTASTIAGTAALAAQWAAVRSRPTNAPSLGTAVSRTGVAEAESAGLTYMDLTDPIRQAKGLADAVAELSKTFGSLTSAGYDWHAAAASMDDQVQALYDNYRALGQDVPGWLQEIIDYLKTMGDVTDGLGSLAADAGYKTIAQYQAIADQAKAVYDEMVASSQYGTAELAKAWDAYMAAADAALTGEAKKFSDQLKALDDELKTLTASVAAEAEEEVMGVVEAQQRARIAEIEAEKEKLLQQQAAAEEVSAHVTDTAQQDYETLFKNVVDDSAKAALEVAKQWASPPWGDWPDPPVYAAPAYGGPQAAGGEYLATRPTLFLAGEAGPELAAFSGAGHTSFGEAPMRPVELTLYLTNVTELDGRVVAKNQKKHGPNEFTLSGL